MEAVDPVFKPFNHELEDSRPWRRVYILSCHTPLFLASLLLHSLHSLAYSGTLNDAFWKDYRYSDLGYPEPGFGCWLSLTIDENGTTSVFYMYLTLSSISKGICR